MNTYNVHIYRVMRLYFPSITAHIHEEAARIAAEKPTGDAAYTDECDGETVGALVDVVGDEEYRHSRTIHFETDRTAAPAMLKALEILITNYPHLLEEKMTPQDAAAIRSACEQGRNAGVSPTFAQEGDAGHPL
jgi:hypothetical protein